MVCRFIENLKKGVNKRQMLLTPFIETAELRSAENMWILENQKMFSEQKLKTLSKDLKLIRDENDIFRCEGRLKNAPLPYETKMPILINPEHYLAELLVLRFHKSLKHISVKQTLTELRQKYWILRGRNFVRKIVKNCTICKRYEGPPFQYPATPSLTKLRLNDTHAFHTVGIDNFGPLFIKPIFGGQSDSLPMYKVWVTLYTCAASRGIMLDIVPKIDSNSFIKSFRRFISRRGCPSIVISDGGKNFTSTESQEFISNLGVTWRVNVPLAPWHGGFFERLVRSTKILLRKALHCCKLNFEELNTILLEIESIMNNRPLTHVYMDSSEVCLSPNHLLFGRNLCHFSPEPCENLSINSNKLSNIVNHFWDRWRREYVVSLREHQKIVEANLNRPVVKTNDVVIVEESRLPRSRWLLESSDGNIRTAVVKLVKTNSTIKRPVNKLYLVESMDANVNEINNNSNRNERPRREAKELGELRRKYLC